MWDGNILVLRLMSLLGQSNGIFLQPLVRLGLSLAVLMYRLVKKSFRRRWEEEGEGVCQVVACTSHQTEGWYKYL